MSGGWSYQVCYKTNKTQMNHVRDKKAVESTQTSRIAQA